MADLSADELRELQLLLGAHRDALARGPWSKKRPDYRDTAHNLQAFYEPRGGELEVMIRVVTQARAKGGPDEG